VEIFSDQQDVEIIKPYDFYGFLKGIYGIYTINVVIVLIYTFLAVTYNRKSGEMTKINGINHRVNSGLLFPMQSIGELTIPSRPP
jgi:hypothetical protein